MEITQLSEDIVEIKLESGKKNSPQFMDYLIAIPISIIYWWQGLRKECPESPDGRHGLILVRANKAGCQYCGKPPKRVAPDAKGRDR